MAENQINEDIESDLKERKLDLTNRVANAIKNAPFATVDKINTIEKIEVEEAESGKSGLITLRSPGMLSNMVLLDEYEEHLLPWLRKEISDQLGVPDDEESKKGRREEVLHEFAHNAASLDAEKIYSRRMGFSLYWVITDKGIFPGILPFVRYRGKATPEEYIKILEAPGEDMTDNERETVNVLKNLFKKQLEG